MRTSKPISTISYNTIDFLERRLKELTEKHIISNYMFIKHYAEKDETKNHIHLYMQPNKLIDTMDLQDYFFELDFNNPNKPLKCIDFRTSSIDDWILYSLHYQPYLLSKLEQRDFSYTKDDFYYYDSDLFERDYLHAFKGSQFAHTRQIMSILFDSNNNPLDLIGCGAVPLNLAPSLVALQNLKNMVIERIMKIMKKENDIISMEKFFDMDSVHNCRCSYSLPCNNCQYFDTCQKFGINKDNFYDKFADKYKMIK